MVLLISALSSPVIQTKFKPLKILAVDIFVFIFKFITISGVLKGSHRNIRELNPLFPVQCQFVDIFPASMQAAISSDTRSVSYRDHAAVFQNGFQFSFIHQGQNRLVNHRARTHSVSVSSIGLWWSRDHRQRAECFTQQGKVIFRPFGTGRIDDNQGRVPHQSDGGLAETAEGTRQQSMNHFIFQGIFFRFSFTMLLMFQLFNFRLQFLFNHQRWRHFLLLKH